MLHISIHAGPLKDATRFNAIAWVDIVYGRLDVIADYKTVLFQNGLGASPVAPIYTYPRWSASLWDLIARALALGLRTDVDVLNYEVPEVTLTRKLCAFASRISVLVEHTATRSKARKTLASAEITQHKQVRGTYVARFEEHGQKYAVLEPFSYQPDFFRPAELLLHACLMRLSGKLEFPPVPSLCLPDILRIAGKDHISVNRLVEPARTGFTSWLRQKSKALIPDANGKPTLARASLYQRFLKEAI